MKKVLLLAERYGSAAFQFDLHQMGVCAEEARLAAPSFGGQWVKWREGRFVEMIKKRRDSMQNNVRAKLQKIKPNSPAAHLRDLCLHDGTPLQQWLVVGDLHPVQMWSPNSVQHPWRSRWRCQQSSRIMCASCWEISVPPPLPSVIHHPTPCTHGHTLNLHHPPRQWTWPGLLEIPFGVGDVAVDWPAVRFKEATGTYPADHDSGDCKGAAHCRTTLHSVCSAHVSICVTCHACTPLHRCTVL